MLSKSKFGIIVAAAFLLTACANTYNRTETGGTERTGVHLDESVAVLVTTPKDGGYGGRIYGGSGVAVARIVDSSFSRYARIVDVYPSEYHSLGDLKDIIAKNDYGYIVVPTISIWERRTTDWSKTPTQVSVKMSVIDVATGKEISSNFLEAKGASSSSLVSFFGSSIDRPEDLLSDLTDDYVDTLYSAIF